MPILRSVSLPTPHQARRLSLAVKLLASLVMSVLLQAPAVSALPMAQQIAISCVDTEEEALLTQINAYRAQNGMGPLQLSQTLGDAADAHSVEMATNSYLDHTMLGGVTVDQNLENYGYGDDTYGENIAGGMEGAAGVLAAWQGSASHNANMLRAEFTAIGIARAYNPSSGYGWYWTTIFGGTVDTPGVLCDGAASAAPAVADVVAEPETTLAAVDANAGITDDLNLRSGPGAEFDSLGTVPRDSRLTVTGPAESGYYPVTYGEQTGWVAAEFVSLDTEPAAEPQVVESAQTVAAPQATEGTALAPLNLRAGPGRDSAVLLTMPEGSVVPVSGEANNGYLSVTYDGTTGWVDAAYLGLPDSSTAPAPTTPAENSGVLAAPVSPGGAAQTTSDLNLRAGPGVDESVLLVIPGGQPLSLTGEVSGDYVGVSYNGTEGWVDVAFLTTLA